MEKNQIREEQEVRTVIIKGDRISRKQAEVCQNLVIQVMEILNRSGDKANLIREILYFIKKYTNCESVGIRLKGEEDFPYYEITGFSREFVKAERSLCSRDKTGNTIRDLEGNPALECMCGAVISARTKPSLPFFTDGGSFWTNCTTDLLVNTSEQDIQGITQNHCYGEGYESVALIPLRTEGEIFGLLQLNDKKKNMYNLEMIHCLEGIGAGIGITFKNIHAEEALKESEEKYRTLFETMTRGVVYQNAEGYIISANPAAEEILGLSLGQMQGRESTDPIWISIHEDGSDFPEETHPALVALKTKKKIEDVVMGVFNPKEKIYRWIKITAVPHFRNGEIEPSQVYTTFEDITAIKASEKAISEQEKLEEVLEIAGAVCHELSQPMQALTGFTQLLLMDMEGGRNSSDRITKIKGQVERMGKITKKLIGITRHETKESHQGKIIDLNKAPELSKIDE